MLQLRQLRALWNDERGIDAIEYGIIIAGIFLVIVASVSLFASRVVNMYNVISSNVT